MSKESRLNFCTLLAQNYLPRGLALIKSLERHAEIFHIWVLCMDDESYQLLMQLNISSVTPVSFAEINTATLKQAGIDRTLTELCWTCTPLICEYVLQTNPSLLHVTYVDADVMFFASPQILLDKLDDHSILIFEHGFPPHTSYIAEEMGRFNVEVIVFKNDKNGRACLAWWRERCLEWCYYRVEPGRMGDQKYLDWWPELFQGVLIADDSLVGLAPWNFEAYQFSITKEGALIANQHTVLFVHFSKLVMYWQNHYELCRGYAIPPLVKQFSYKPYIVELDKAWDQLMAINPRFQEGFVKPTFSSIMKKNFVIIRRVLGRWYRYYLPHNFAKMVRSHNVHGAA